MRITGVRTFVVGNPTPGYGGRYFIFLKLESDGGLEGLGEVYAATVSPQLVALMIEDVVARHVVGREPFHIEATWRDVYASGYAMRPDPTLVGVLSGIEMAMWDLAGKAVGKPAYELLGGRVRERLRSYSYLYAEAGDATDVYADPDLAARRAAEYAELGFTALKFDPAGRVHVVRPRQPSLDDLDRCERYVGQIREAVGSRCDLLFGTHGQFTVSGAIRIARRLERFEPLWFEEPTPPESPEEMARVARATSIPIATGERLTTKYEFARVLETGAASILQMNLGPRRRPAGGQEDRRHGRVPLRADRAPPLLRPGRRRRQHPARDLHAELPHPGGHRALGRHPCRSAEGADPLGGRLRDAADRARVWASSSTRPSRSRTPTRTRTCTSRPAGGASRAAPPT